MALAIVYSFVVITASISSTAERQAHQMAGPSPRKYAFERMPLIIEQLSRSQLLCDSDKSLSHDVASSGSNCI